MSGIEEIESGTTDFVDVEAEDEVFSWAIIECPQASTHRLELTTDSIEIEYVSNTGRRTLKL